MTLISLIDARLAFGLHPLLDRADFTVAAGERIGLIGRNGTGKSSLLSVLARRTMLDEGEVRSKDGLAVAFVEQESLVPPPPENPDAQQRLRALRHRWGLPEVADPSTENMASGGERKRAALAAAFAAEPDLLLLDEPTNHLDIAAILTLEEMVLRGPACIVVTHDRRFLDRVATRIIELDRGVLRSYPGNFAAYTARKAGELAAEALANRRFDKFWAQEESWIRQGVEARRTRNEGRVKRLESLREARAARRERVGQVRFSLDAGERSGKLVVELEGISKSFGERPIVRDLSLRLMRGDRLALIGGNGAGKTTLLRLILGELEPDAGRVRRGTQLNVAYFDQMRAALDPALTVAETISPGSDWVLVNGERRHVTSYLSDFLFPSRRARSPVSMLSGGERHRLLLARLFAQPANLLVLDEPTNDLDMDSLELLEQTLQDYPGTLLLVSHDRAFVDAVATQTLVAEGDGHWREYVGGYSEYERQRPDPARTAASSPPAAPPPAAPSRDRRRLSYRERQELDALPSRLEALEAEQVALTDAMGTAEYARRPAGQLRADRERLVQIAAELEEGLGRWERLEALRHEK